jgi:hypothetical protein
MSERKGRPSPPLETRGPATRESDRAKSQEQLGSTTESDSTPTDFQACKLRRGKTVAIAFLLTAPRSHLSGVAA